MSTKRSGYILLMVMFFVVVSLISALTIGSYVTHITREFVINEKKSSQAYYTAVAGARYAYILLKDPVANFGFIDADLNGETPKSITISNSSQFGRDMHLDDNDVMTIKVEEWDEDITEWPEGNYKVTVTLKT